MLIFVASVDLIWLGLVLYLSLGCGLENNGCVYCGDVIVIVF